MLGPARQSLFYWHLCTRQGNSERRLSLCRPLQTPPSTESNHPSCTTKIANLVHVIKERCAHQTAKLASANRTDGNMQTKAQKTRSCKVPRTIRCGFSQMGLPSSHHATTKLRCLTIPDPTTVSTFYRHNGAIPKKHKSKRILLTSCSRRPLIQSLKNLVSDVCLTP